MRKGGHAEKEGRGIRMKESYIMKKIAAILLSVVLTVSLLAGCGKKGASDTEGGQASEDTGNKDGGISVLLLVPGTLGDKSFFDSANAGLGLIEEHYGAETKVVEMGTDITKYSAALEDVINEGWDVIITGGVNISQPLQEAAEEYPDQKFILYDESVDFSDGANSNIFCITYKCYEGGYLAGVLAAGTSETNEIGFAGGFDIPLINDWLVGYIEGAKLINPDIKVNTGYMNSFTDAAKGKEIGVALYNSGADIVFQAAGGAGLGVLDAAKETGNHAIGTDSDQSELFSSDAEKADAIYASILKRVDLSIDKAIGKFAEGSLEFGAVEIYGLSDGCIEITDNEWYQKNVPAEVRDKITEAKQSIIDGEVEIKSAFDMTDEEVAKLRAEVQP